MPDVDPTPQQIQVEIAKDGVAKTAWTNMQAFLSTYQAQGYYIVNSRGIIGSTQGGAIPRGTFIPQLEQQACIAYGHSYLQANFQNTVGCRYIDRLVSRARMKTPFTNNALAGSDLGSAALRANGNTATKFTPGKQFVLVDALFNQLSFGGFITAPAKAAFANGARSLLACLSSSSKVEDSAMTKNGPGGVGAGSWSTDTLSNWSGGTMSYTSTVGDQIKANVTVTAAGKVDVWLLCSDVAWPLPQGNFSIYVDGVKVISGTGASQWLDTGAAENLGYGPMVVTLSGLTAGVHEIKVIKDAGPGVTNLSVDCFLVRSATPPPIAFLKMPVYNYASYSAAYGYLTTDAERVQMNLLMDQICASEFPNVITIDPSVVWDATTMAGADAVHPNDHGHSALADLYEQILAQYLPWTPGLHTGVAA